MDPVRRDGGVAEEAEGAPDKAGEQAPVEARAVPQILEQRAGAAARSGGSDVGSVGAMAGALLRPGLCA